MTCRKALHSLLAGLLLAGSSWGADWIVAPSYFTHDPETGERVTQYARAVPGYTYARPDFMRSGYRHTRSSLQVGGSADHMHVVEEWGRAVRPYGEWRFPFRPYSVPYPMWGSPFAGMQYPGYFPPYPMAAPYGQAAGDGFDAPYDRQQPPPYYDGSYPPYQTRPRYDQYPQRGPMRGDRRGSGHQRGPVDGPASPPRPEPRPGPGGGSASVPGALR